MAIVNKVDQKAKVDIDTTMTELGIFKSPQSARNAITKASKKNLVIKDGNNKKKISINQDLNVQTTGPVLLDYKILGIES